MSIKFRVQTYLVTFLTDLKSLEDRNAQMYEQKHILFAHMVDYLGNAWCV